MSRPYENLRFYKQICELRSFVYVLTERFRKSHMRLVGQMRDAARSAKQNVREGYKMGTLGQFIHSIKISLGSLEELSGDMEDCNDDGLISGMEYDKFTRLFGSIGFLAGRYIESAYKMERAGTWKIPREHLRSNKKHKKTSRNFSKPQETSRNLPRVAVSEKKSYNESGVKIMRRKGFTMIELLVVIGIIGLLAVFLVPNLLGARDRAKEAAVKGVMHSIQLALEAYEMENQIYPIESGIGVETLCKNYLMPGEYVGSTPKNPFTGQEYKDADLAGKIIYKYDDKTAVYTLTGYKRSGIRKIQELTNL